MPFLPDNQTGWYGLTGLVVAVGAFISGLYASRNSRLKDTDTLRLEERKNEDNTRLATLVAIGVQLQAAVKTVRDLEEEIRTQRNDHEIDRRRIERERDEARFAFDGCYEFARKLRHAQGDTMMRVIHLLKEQSIAIPPELWNYPMPLPPPDSFFVERK